MATTVTAPGADSIWAPGEPGATVSLDPPVSEEQGPFYFDERVIPDPSRVDTSVDGGVIVVGAEPGDYLWTGHKEGVDFEPLLMRRVGGWLTNAAPPRGMNARILEQVAMTLEASRGSSSESSSDRKRLLSSSDPSSSLPGKGPDHELPPHVVRHPPRLQRSEVRSDQQRCQGR